VRQDRALCLLLAAGAAERHHCPAKRGAEVTAPTIARGNVRECLAALLEKAIARELADRDPQRRARLGRLVRYLTQRLARRILREYGRELSARGGGHK
jgi:hypothetical protein